ncbi:MAG: DUF1343 domain-containing protein [Flavipsychrobacter sp.]|nr:DUF1343 domain-containing protein [Flavipsychrobacter sp.]
MVLMGIDRFIAGYEQQQDYRWGLVTNEVALTSTGKRSRKALLDAGFNLIRLFSPEHGLGATGADGERQQDGIDSQTGLPVISLYGDKMAPDVEDLVDIDVVLFDIPDVGCRYYTYLWTLSYVMERCASLKKPLYILDRPNPLGGDPGKVEGPMLDENHCSSFIGRWSIPLRHSCTLGELARYFAATRLPELDLHVIPLRYWNRMAGTTEAGWIFTPTSPAIRDLETALLYPGTGLLEGIFINEGRGTARPFTCCGAPWINGEMLANAFTALNLPGVACKPVSYIPDSSIYQGESCQGLQFHVTNEAHFHPVSMGIQLIQLLMRLYPDQVMERRYYTAANPDGSRHLDKLLGIPGAFSKISSDQFPLLDVGMDWKQLMAAHLLY